MSKYYSLLGIICCLLLAIAIVFIPVNGMSSDLVWYILNIIIDIVPSTLPSIHIFWQTSNTFDEFMVIFLVIMGGYVFAIYPLIILASYFSEILYQTSHQAKKHKIIKLQESFKL